MIHIRISVIDNKILCVHGGLSPSITTLDQIRSIDRKVKEKILSVVQTQTILFLKSMSERGGFDIGRL